DERGEHPRREGVDRDGARRCDGFRDVQIEEAVVADAEPLRDRAEADEHETRDCRRLAAEAIERVPEERDADAALGRLALHRAEQTRGLRLVDLALAYER